ncbi:7-deoxyloganetic acid glucosyltransferase-like [Diospyros lotus]|uniref:7-deoxyloganetic acid glucosyltransferase-like n=1 Tax=Diospyros lotus TaxID=55363 RepID=UPI00224D8DD8|nr:7-deoxyloganetic acid glucosyltransferase-like [Diospyros lotus]
MAEQQGLPHLLIFPLPLQGPVNSMLKLAELLCLSGIYITFLVTDHVHSRLLRFTDIQTRFSRYPGRFRLDSISDGLPEDHPRLGHQLMEMFHAWETVTKPLFRRMMTSGDLGPDSRSPVTCIIADGILGFTIDVAKEIGVPVICIRTISPCCLWIFCCLPKLIQAGELRSQETDLDALVSSVPGMEGILRRRDLPTFCRPGNSADPMIQLFSRESQQISRANGLILNTFEDLEGPLLSHIRKLCPNLYTIGPLHLHLKTRLAAESISTASSASFRKEDKSCLAWLDKQEPKSVIYVSFGSLATASKDQIMEIWHGLVNSGKRFLWAIRGDSVAEHDCKGGIAAELRQGTAEKGCIVDWAPQEEVLAHDAVGAFLTHCGWNSILESICEGVPMICWPFFLDQHINGRFVEKVWNVGLDMKDVCDRRMVEKMVKHVMELMGCAERTAEMARRAVSRGGSSHGNLDRLVEDIRSKYLNGN